MQHFLLFDMSCWSRHHTIGLSLFYKCLNGHWPMEELMQNHFIAMDRDHVPVPMHYYDYYYFCVPQFIDIMCNGPINFLKLCGSLIIFYGWTKCEHLNHNLVRWHSRSCGSSVLTFIISFTNDGLHLLLLKISKNYFQMHACFFLLVIHFRFDCIQFVDTSQVSDDTSFSLCSFIKIIVFRFVCDASLIYGFRTAWVAQLNKELFAHDYRGLAYLIFLFFSTFLFSPSFRNSNIIHWIISLLWTIFPPFSISLFMHIWFEWIHNRASR